MTHEEVIKLCPRNRTLVGNFIPIQELDNYLEEIQITDISEYFSRHYEYEIPLIYYAADTKLHHLIFSYKPVIAYIAFEGENDFYLGLLHDSNEGSYEIFNPLNEDNEELVLVAKTRSFEDIVEIIKDYLVKYYNVKKENIFSSAFEIEKLYYNLN